MKRTKVQKDNAKIAEIMKARKAAKAIAKAAKKVAAALVILFLTGSTAFAETASWYSVESCKREGTSGICANGEVLDDEAYTCAVWDKKFGTKLKVTNLENGLSVIVVVTDRGPAKRLVRQGRTIDLSRAAFRAIANLKSGIIQIKVEVI